MRQIHLRPPPSDGPAQRWPCLRRVLDGGGQAGAGAAGAAAQALWGLGLGGERAPARPPPICSLLRLPPSARASFWPQFMHARAPCSASKQARRGTKCARALATRALLILLPAFWRRRSLRTSWGGGAEAAHRRSACTARSATQATRRWGSALIAFLTFLPPRSNSTCRLCLGPRSGSGREGRPGQAGEGAAPECCVCLPPPCSRVGSCWWTYVP